MEFEKERLMILNMIAEGRITAEEGEQLFRALDASEAKDEIPSEELTDVPDESALPPVPPVPPIPSLDPVPPVPPVHAVPHVAPVPHIAAIPHVAPVPPIPAVFPQQRQGSASLVAALREAGIDRLTLSDVQEMQIHNITPEYIREMTTLGIHPANLSEWCDQIGRASCRERV
jgi:hypothetical protein